MVRRLAVKAGHVTLQHFDESGFHGADVKGDGSPVTIADRAAEAVIEAGLKEILPDVPVIGEEAAEAGKLPNLSGAEYFWLVDPLDGTKEFISGSGDYTVNIALIHNGMPVIGVVYAPVKGELYAGCGEGTALRWLEDTNAEKEIRVRRPPAGGLTIVASRNHGNDAALDKFLSDYKVEKLIKRGSSLKICAVASGKADLYPRFGNTCEWDTAAGDAILRAAGGMLTTVDRQPFTYGHAGRKFLNPEFIAAPADFFNAVADQG
jgi:3'(2'), 5'-bisphosphate nucleotidase